MNLQADNAEVQDAVTAVARKFARGFPRYELDDLKQEGFVAIIGALPQYRDYLGKPFDWAYTVAQNRLTDLVRSHVTENERREELADYPVDHDHAEDETWKVLWASLSPWTRAVLLLQLGSTPKQLSVRKIAKTIGLPVRDCLWLVTEMRMAYQILGMFKRA